MPVNILPETILAKSTTLWDLPENITIRLINVSENLTYLLEVSGIYKSILRVHRPGYRTDIEIESELDWLDKLQSENLMAIPSAIRGKNGARIQKIRSQKTGDVVNLVMFEFVEGYHPQEDQDHIELFHILGQMAATLHEQVRQWSRPTGFYRQHWNLDTILGENPVWGKWQDAPGITAEISSILTRAEKSLIQSISAFGKSSQNYGLIHADMRLANILLNRNQLTLIDFDDCGFGWFLYDFAASVSFIENHPKLEDFKQEWLEGYREVQSISKSDENMIDSFVMLRRLTLLAWVGSHSESDEPKLLAPYFAQETAEYAETYLIKSS